MNTSFETLWIVVDEDGGHLTDGFDASVTDSTRVPLYGAYGPFRGAMNPSESSTSAQFSLNPDGGGTEPGARANGYARYYNRDTFHYEGIPGAEVPVTCHDQNSRPMRQYSYTEHTGSGTNAGYFSIQCDDGYETIQAGVLLENHNVRVQGKDGAFAGVPSFFLQDGDEGVEVRAGNDAAAHVYATLQDRIPAAEFAFGRYRSIVLAYAAESDPDYGIYYCPTSEHTGCPTDDVILTNDTRIFGEDGYFVSVHEYGHGFHYYAIEPWDRAGPRQRTCPARLSRGSPISSECGSPGRG